MTSVSLDIGMQNLRILEYYFSGCGLCCLLHEILRLTLIESLLITTLYTDKPASARSCHWQPLLSEAPIEILHYSNGRSLDVHETTYYNYDPSDN